MGTPKSSNELLPHLFRQEYAKMTAVLCRHFGLKHIEIAEDIASETFLKASEFWATNGIPDNPTAWLYTVARNKTKDYFKHLSLVEAQSRNKRLTVKVQNEHDFEFSDQVISDSLLSMIFAVCKPSIPPQNQICLALQILCGFSVEEIANAFLTQAETIKKRLLRARATLRRGRFQINPLSGNEIKSRLANVLKTLYLLFNEGYFSKTNNQLIRKELCYEAIRLAVLLSENALTNTPETNALLSLMCFQSSRIPARKNDRGETVLFEDQDKNLWDGPLIQKGIYYLINASTGNEVSKYHLEAGIAYWHSTSNDDDKWQHILHLYDQLLSTEYSPITALNRIFAFSKVFGNKKALQEARKLTFTESNYFHELLGYLYSELDIDKAIDHYLKAIEFTRSKTEKQTLLKEVKRLKENKT